MRRTVILKYATILILSISVSQILVSLFTGSSRLLTSSIALNDSGRSLGILGSRHDYGLSAGSVLYDDDQTKKLVEAVKIIHKARIYARGSKTSGLLTKSLDLLDGILLKLHYNVTKLHSRETYPSTSVCPEGYKGTTFGYPFFHKGFELQTCSYGKPLSGLVSIILDPAIFSDEQILTGQLNDISIFTASLDKRLTIIVSSHERDTETKYKNIRFVYVGNKSIGEKWNALINEAKTKYVLLARRVNSLTTDIRLERLIREIESQGVSIAGAATRNQDGHWKLGCKQSVYRNYSITYEDGYLESLHECIFCDHIDGPFVADKKIFKDIKLHSRLPESGLFEDFFLRYTEKYAESIICPDSMFFIQSSPEHKKRKWEPFAKLWNLYKLKLDSKEMVFPCTFADCFSKGHGVPPCCLQELSNSIKLLMQACEKAGMFCELQEGTLLGAVKFSKVLPWERDADVAFLSANYSAFKNLRQTFESAGYSLSDGKSLWCCADNRTAGGKYIVYTKHWHIELYGQHLMDSEVLATKGLKPTKIFFDGIWVTGPTNPGRFARNRYGHEIYRHAQHWMAVGAESGWINYNTNKFTKCSNPHSHSCLDQYKADGNMQFSDPLP